MKRQEIYEILAKLYKQLQDIEAFIESGADGSVFHFTWKDGENRRFFLGAELVQEFTKMKVETARKVVKIVKKRIKQLELELKETKV